jgi:NAD(P)-dependent dehydrogenase (short-subunit alcohol dehydrogenase family)
MHRFTGKAAIVTGGSQGLGRAFAERLGREGARVLITGRTSDNLDRAVAELEAAGIEASSVCGDVADASAIDEIVDTALQRWGGVDVLVNNAGVFDEAEFLEIERENWNYVIAVMLTAPFLLAQRCGREMIRRGGGAIVNIASIDAHVADGPYASYGAAKAGLIALTKYIAVELADKGVRCNSISPGWTRTPMVEAACGPALIEQMESNFSRVPIRRLLTVDEIAAACAFLASEEASAITGTDLIVDGGTLADAYILPIAAAMSEAAEAAPGNENSWGAREP